MFVCNHDAEHGMDNLQPTISQACRTCRGENHGVFTTFLTHGANPVIGVLIAGASTKGRTRYVGN